jgi:hypothetical protein
MTGLIALIANTMHRPDHGLYTLDNQLIEIGMNAVDSIAVDPKVETMNTFRTVSKELFRDARQRHGVAIGATESTEFGTGF